MKKLKKVLAFALAAAMVSSFTGCGEDKKETQWDKIKKQVYENQKQNTPATTLKPSAPSLNQSNTPSAPTASASSGTKLPLNTTANFKGLRLERLSDRNDLIGHEIKKNTNNKVSRLTGAEPEYKVAVDTFNEIKNKDNKFVAYKVLEYHQFKPEDKEYKALVKLDQYKGTTEYYRFTFEIYQYEKSAEAAKYDQYTDTSYDPHYLRVTVCKIDGQYKRITYMTSR